VATSIGHRPQPPLARAHSGRTGDRLRDRFPWRRVTPYLLIFPAIVFELLIHVIPMIVGTWMSFIELTQFYLANWREAPSAGLANYDTALNFSNPLGRQLANSFLVTLAFTVLVIGFSYLLGLAAAVVLHRRFRGRGLLRTAFLIPYALPAYAGIITWKFIFQRDTGLANELVVRTLHLTNDAPFWLLGTNAFWVLVLVSIWHQWPFAFLMLMAGMQSIPDELYQSAAIDGASDWQQIRHITLGLMKSVSMVLVLLLFLWTFREFNTPFVLFGAAPPDQANLLVMNIYQSSFVQWNFGLGSAMSVLLMFFLILFSGVWALLNRRVNRDA
jgi:multiple sugar transport system permease protein